jgi:adenosine deaminase
MFEFIAPAKCRNLSDFLKRASSGIELMQTRAELEMVTSDLFTQLEKEKVVYAEIRFAPLQHLKKGFQHEEVVESVSNAVRLCTEKTGIKAGIILCTLRHFSEDQSMQTIKLVEKYISDSAVVGFDIAADEAGYPIDNHKKAFEYAITRGIPRTAHAGEARGPESIIETLKYFKPSRIGHGVRSIEDPELMKMLRESNIHLEICPTCNIQVDVFDTYSNHPIDYLYKSGISLGINTDARTLTNITLSEEYFKLMEEFDWNYGDLLKCNLNAISHAFTSDNEKAYLKHKIIKDYKSLCPDFEFLV